MAAAAINDNRKERKRRNGRSLTCGAETVRGVLV